MVWCCGVVWCGAAWHAENPSVCRFKTPPCVRSRRTHGGVFKLHTEGFSAFSSLMLSVFLALSLLSVCNSFFLSCFLFLIEYRAFQYPYTTSTEHEPKQQRTARAVALMAHHPAWVSHHTGGSRSTPTVHWCRYDGRLWVAQHRHTTHDSDRQ